MRSIRDSKRAESLRGKGEVMEDWLSSNDIVLEKRCFKTAGGTEPNPRSRVTSKLWSNDSLKREGKEEDTTFQHRR